MAKAICALVRGDSRSGMSSAFRELHERLFTIDTHIDTPTASLARDRWNFAERHEYLDDHSQCDLPRMREGGIDALVFAVFIAQALRSPIGWKMATDLACEHIARTHAVIEANAIDCGLALRADDALALKAAGKRAIFLSLENAYSLGLEAENVAKFHQLGVRMIGLTHMLNNDVADSSTDPRGPEWDGLSPFGSDVVAECNRLGIVLDASHASDDVIHDLLGESRAPIILSHSGPRAVCDHPRNVGDALLRDIAAQGGVIHINALPISLVNDPGNRRTEAIADVLLSYQDRPLLSDAIMDADRDYDRVCAEYPNPAVTLADLVRHVEHAVNVVGIDHVGIGCDFDGGGWVEGMSDVSEYPNLTSALIARGWREPDLAKLWGGNTLRVMRSAASAAKI